MKVILILILIRKVNLRPFFREVIRVNFSSHNIFGSYSTINCNIFLKVPIHYCLLRLCQNWKWICREFPRNTYIPMTLFRNERFMLDEMTRQNASKFAIFYIYENPKLPFPFFISCYFICLPNECPGLCRHRPGHSLVKKIK